MRYEKITLLETSIDHLTGEELGLALEALSLAPEILDVLYLPGIGKKNRPAGLLQVICLPESEIAARDAIFRHTHTLGIRRSEPGRYVLPRKQTTVNIEGRELAAKEHLLEGKAYARPEADALKSLAASLGVGAPALRLKKRD